MDLTHDYVVNMHLILMKINMTHNLFRHFKNLHGYLKKMTHDMEKCNLYPYTVL